jgi:hypothetical protein
MANTERVTVTLPTDLVEEIDSVERNRSRFITQAVEREMSRRRHAGLAHSLKHPHSESAELAEAGIREWGSRAAPGDHELLDRRAGKSVRWVKGRGWIEKKK